MSKETFRCVGFAPHIDKSCTVLILGSMPSAASLAAGQYYAHPQNRFWPLMARLLEGYDVPSEDYEERLTMLLRHHVALWDAIDACDREGSLDSAIKNETANDFANLETDVPDYVHFNAMRMNEDGDLIISCRHLSSILCLDRSKNEDQIKWILSGAADEFGLTEDQKTSCQHYASLDGDYITVFDNGNSRGATRICSYLPDPGTGTLKMFRSYAIGGKFTSACGSVQRISGETYMIGWGHAANDAVCMGVYDFETGEELITVELDNPNNFTYRCVYYD